MAYSDPVCLLLLLAWFGMCIAVHVAGTGLFVMGSCGSPHSSYLLGMGKDVPVDPEVPGHLSLRRTPDTLLFHVQWQSRSSRPQPLESGGDATPCEDPREERGLPPSIPATKCCVVFCCAVVTMVEGMCQPVSLRKRQHGFTVTSVVARAVLGV